MTEYLKVIFETAEKDYFCIWQTDLNSGFYKDGDHVACFRDEDVFDAYAAAKGLKIKETMLFDLAELMEFAAGGGMISASVLLNFWNISSDLAFTLGASFLGDDDNETLSEIYDTLFFLTSTDEDADEEDKTLSEDDESDLREVVADGCRLIVTELNAL